MEVLRTPDERFSSLVDFPFTPHYILNLKNIQKHLKSLV
jgi:hypothetical protein